MIETLESNAKQLSNEIENIYERVKELKALRNAKEDSEDILYINALITGLSANMTTLRAISILERAVAQNMLMTVDLHNRYYGTGKAPNGN